MLLAAHLLVNVLLVLLNFSLVLYMITLEMDRDVSVGGKRQ